MIIKVHALMRSGHHAVMDGIYHAMPNDKVFINNCKPNGKFHWFKLNDGKQQKSGIEGKLNKKNILMNFEHKNLKGDTWVNDWRKLKADYNVIILRDPFNWLASSMNKTHFKQKVPLNMGLWVQQAEEILGITKHLPNVIGVTYNQWVTSPEYRKAILDKMGLKYDETYQLEKFKGASSFGKNEGYFERWRHFEKNADFLKKVKLPKVQDYSKKIFNFNPIKND